MNCTRCGADNIQRTCYALCLASTRWEESWDQNEPRFELRTYDDYEIWPISLCSSCLPSAFNVHLRLLLKELFKSLFCFIISFSLTGLLVWVLVTYINIKPFIANALLILLILIFFAFTILFIIVIKNNLIKYIKDRGKIKNNRLIGENEEIIKNACQAEAREIIRIKKQYGTVLKDHQAKFKFPLFKEFEDCPEVNRRFRSEKELSPKRHWEITAIAASLEELHQSPQFLWPQEFEALWPEKTAGLPRS